MSAPISRPATPAALGIALGVLVAAPLSAQDARIITFEDAVDIAFEHNPDLLTIKADAALTGVGVSEAQMPFMPDLRIRAEGGRTFGRTFDSRGDASSRSADSATLDLVSDITLFNGFADVAALRKAQLTKRAGHQELNHVEQTILFRVASGFLTLLQSREQLRVLRENLLAEVALEQQIEGYVEAGSREVAVLYQQEANVAAARLAVVQGKNLTQSDEIDLLRTLQLDPDGAYDFALPALSTDEPPEPPDRSDLLARAASQRVDLKAWEARVAAAEQQVTIARSSSWPKVSLSASYGGEYSSLDGASFHDQLSDRGGIVGLTVSMPIFDRGAADNKIRRAQLETLKTRIALDAAREEVNLQVRKAHQDYHAAREQVFAAQEQAEASERAVQTAEERFKAGVTSLVEVTQARARHVAAARALVDARWNMQFQNIRLDYVVGGMRRSSFAAR